MRVKLAENDQDLALEWAQIPDFSGLGSFGLPVTALSKHVYTLNDTVMIYIYINIIHTHV